MRRLALLVPALLGAAASAAPASAPARCRLGGFSLALGPLVSEATGQHTLVLRLVNHSAARCVLAGYPRVVLRDASGTIPFAIHDGGDQMVTWRPPRPVVVPPKGAAWVALHHYRCDRGDIRAALQVTLASAGGSATLRLDDRYRRPAWCGRGDPGSTLSVSPFEPSFRAALGGR